MSSFRYGWCSRLFTIAQNKLMATDGVFLFSTRGHRIYIYRKPLDLSVHCIFACYRDSAFCSYRKSLIGYLLRRKSRCSPAIVLEKANYNYHQNTSKCPKAAYALSWCWWGRFYSDSTLLSSPLELLVCLE